MDVIVFPPVFNSVPVADLSVEYRNVIVTLGDVEPNNTQDSELIVIAFSVCQMVLSSAFVGLEIVIPNARSGCGVAVGSPPGTGVAGPTGVLPLDVANRMIARVAAIRITNSDRLAILRLRFSITSLPAGGPVVFPVRVSENPNSE